MAWEAGRSMELMQDCIPELCVRISRIFISVVTELEVHLSLRSLSNKS